MCKKIHSNTITKHLNNKNNSNNLKQNKMKEQLTAVEWFAMITKELGYVYEAQFQQAKEMEKKQIVKHSVELTKILISNPFETSGKTPTELMDNYFKETFKQQEQ